MLRQGRLLRSPARRIGKDVSLAPNPNSHDIKLLQLEGPIRHLLTPTPIVQLRVREDIVLMVDITITPKPFDELLMRHDSLPQSVQLALHGRPPKLHIQEAFRHNANDLRSLVGLRPLSQGRSPPVVRSVNKHLEWSPRSLWASSRLEVDVDENEIIAEARANREEGIPILRVLVPQSEVSTLFPKRLQHLLVLQPSGLQVLTKVVHEAQERIHCIARSWLRPLTQLLHLPRLNTAPLGIAYTTPELNRLLVVLALARLELETRARRRLAKALAVINVLLKSDTAHQDIVHAGARKLSPTTVPKRPETLRNVALHLGWSGCWAERHPQPLVQTRPSADHEHALRRLIKLELRVSPNGIHNGVMLLEGCHRESSRGIRRRECANLELFVHWPVGAHKAPKHSLGVLIHHEHRRGPLRQALFPSINLTQLTELHVFLDVKLDSSVIVRRDRYGLTSHRLSALLEPKAYHMVANQGGSAAIDPETLWILS